jgi:iron(III) transport system substrate-binding protein
MDSAKLTHDWQARAVRVWLRVRPFILRWKKELGILLALFVVLTGPFLLRPAESVAPSRYDRRLVIITPHHEKIRDEFARAFAKHWKQKTGETLYMDWRVPGGTSEITMFMKSEFTGAFQHRWETELGKKWSAETTAALLNPKVSLTETNDASVARKAFMESDTSIGVDLFFGGGAYDFQSLADAGLLVSSDAKQQHGLASLKAKNPALFSNEVIPGTLSGEPYHDPDLRWAGTCLSSFGIVFNRDVLRRLGLEKEPSRWEDLADPRLMGQVALADPTKSGSVTRAFEMIIQQQMHLQIAEVEKIAKKMPGKYKTPKDVEMEGIRRGWEEGIKLIQRIAANARYFTDSAPKIPLEVSRGDAAAGMCIDFYGRSTEDQVRGEDGRSRIGFVSPTGGTSVGADPIAMVRGAPEPELATAFMEFVLSERGQSLWSFRAGMPGGPAETALRRLPIRRDFYSEKNLALMSDPAERPYEKAAAFIYHPERTGPMFNTIRFLIRVMCIDTHHEQKEAWKALVEAGFPEEAQKKFHDTKLVSYDNAMTSIGGILRSRDKVQEVRKARELGDLFRRNYELTKRLAYAGR